MNLKQTIVDSDSLFGIEQVRQLPRFLRPRSVHQMMGNTRFIHNSRHLSDQQIALTSSPLWKSSIAVEGSTSKENSFNNTRSNFRFWFARVTGHKNSSITTEATTELGLTCLVGYSFSRDGHLRQKPNYALNHRFTNTFRVMSCNVVLNEELVSLILENWILNTLLSVYYIFGPKFPTIHQLSQRHLEVMCTTEHAEYLFLWRKTLIFSNNFVGRWKSISVLRSKESTDELRFVEFGQIWPGATIESVFRLPKQVRTVIHIPWFGCSVSEWETDSVGVHLPHIYLPQTHLKLLCIPEDQLDLVGPWWEIPDPACEHEFGSFTKSC